MQHKKLLLLVAMFFGAIILQHNASAYLDCSPPSCPAGYEYNGTTICEGSTCTAYCQTYECTQDWTQVHYSTYGWPSGGQQWPASTEKEKSASYNPTDTSLCYKFRYDGPDPNDSFIRMVINTSIPNSPDCDTEGIGGFFEGTGYTGSSTSWFNGMNNFISDSIAHQDVKYLMKILRGHANAGADSNYRINMSYNQTAEDSDAIFCVPTNSISCDGLGGTKWCDNDCYNKETEAYTTQGYYQTQSNPDRTLYIHTACNRVIDNRMKSVEYFVYSSPTTLSSNTTSVSCDRTNEPPIVYDIQVVPESPNTGQDLECTFNYTDPENFQEQGSTFEWWKNSANQNINARILDRGNLTVSDSWSCKVTPSDGLTFGNQSASTNSVTIQTTIKDPSFVIGNSLIFEVGGYYGDTEEIFDFNDTLQSAIDACTPDQAGLCTIDLLFSSSATGTMDLSNMQIFYTQPQPNIRVANLTQLETSGLSVVLGFEIVNELNFDRTVNWTLDMGDTNTIVNNLEIALNASEDAFVFAQYTYGGAGTYIINATAYNETYIGSMLLNVTV